MWLTETILELIAPTRCSGCDLPGAVLCERCRAESLHPEPANCCPSCGAPHGALVCTECWSTTFAFSRAVSVGELSGPLARAVVLHKDAGERRLGAVLGDLVAAAIPMSWTDWADTVTPIPATRAALRRRGFDHAHVIAEAIADHARLPLGPLLARHAAEDQRRLGRRERSQNAVGSFTVVAEVPERILVVDDVFTTGATLDAAANELLAAGAREVRVAVVARAW